MFIFGLFKPAHTVRMGSNNETSMGATMISQLWLRHFLSKYRSTSSLGELVHICLEFLLTG